MAAYSAATRRAYAVIWGAWLLWCEWAATQEALATLDAYGLLTVYLTERWRGDASPATLQSIYTGLRAGHAAAGLDWPDPDRALPTRWRLALDRRGLARKQAQQLTASRLAAIETAEGVPQRTRVIALIRVMRDGLLDVGAVRTRRWADVETDETGLTRIRVMHPEREIWLSPATAQAVVAMRPAGWSTDDPIWGIKRDGLLRVPRAGTLTIWIRRAALAAGLGDGYTGRSPRYGMLADLPAHVGRDPLPAALGWADRYGNAEVVRWYATAPPQADDTSGSGSPVAPVSDDEPGPQLRAWLEGQEQSAAWLWQRLGIPAATVKEWRSGRARMPGWMPLVLAADRRAGGATPDGAPGLEQAKQDGQWSVSALAAGLGVARQTIQRWLIDGAPDLVLRYAIGELELRVPPAGRRGRGAAAKLSDPSYRVIDWPQDGSAPGEEADAGTRAVPAEARTPRGTDGAGGGTAQEAGATPRDTPDAGGALRDVASLEHTARTQLVQAIESQRLDRWEQADDGYRAAAAAGLDARTPHGREIAADALARRADRLGARLESAGSPERIDAAYREVVDACREAADAGRRAATPRGREIAARMKYNSGVYLERSGGSEAEIEDAHHEAAVFGRAAESSMGLIMVARAGSALANAYARWGRPQSEVVAAYRGAAEAGREADTADGRLIATRALAALADRLAEWRRPEDAVATYREAADAGRAAGGPEGLEIAARALLALASHGAQSGASPEEVVTAHREAAELGREAGTAGGWLVATRALAALADRLAEWRRLAEAEAAYGESALAADRAATLATDEINTRTGYTLKAQALLRLSELVAAREPSAAVATYREAADAGRAAGGPEGLEIAARALLALASHGAQSGASPEEVVTAHREAAELGREAGTAGGWLIATRALAALADRLAEWRRLAEAEAAYGESALAADRAATLATDEINTRRGHTLKAQALLRLSELVAARKPSAAVATYGEAADAGRAAGGPEGLEIAARALLALGRLRRDWGREEAEPLYREAAATGRAANTAAGREIAATALFGLGEDLGSWWPATRLEAEQEALAEMPELFQELGLVFVHDARSIANREAPGWDQPLHDLETAYFAGRAATYREAEEVGLNVGTNQGLEIVTKARYRLAELKRRTEQPPHLAALARRALSRVGASHATKVRPYPEAAALYRSAGDAGRAAGTPDGLEIAERVRDILRDD